MTRFDLEEQIMSCWNVVDDVNTLFKAVSDTGLSTDEISNVLLGITSLYQLKFSQLQETLEELIQEGKLV